MPAPLVAYWTAWNEADLDAVAGHLAAAVEPGVVWNDPRDSFTGIADLEAAIRRLRTSKPAYRFAIVSEIDHHHDRYRYRWDMIRGHRVLLEGLDIVTVSPGSGLIVRVDGFFGHPTPLADGPSGVPERFRPPSARPNVATDAVAGR